MNLENIEKVDYLLEDWNKIKVLFGFKEDFKSISFDFGSSTINFSKHDTLTNCIFKALTVRKIEIEEELTKL